MSDLLSSDNISGPSRDGQGIMAANLRNAFANHRYGVFGFWSFLVLAVGLLIVISVIITVATQNETLSNSSLNTYALILISGVVLLFLIYFNYLRSIGSYLYTRVKSPFTE
jgi:hypothetical protein